MVFDDFLLELSRRVTQYVGLIIYIISIRLIFTVIENFYSLEPEKQMLAILMAYAILGSYIFTRFYKKYSSQSGFLLYFFFFFITFIFFLSFGQIYIVNVHNNIYVNSIVNSTILAIFLIVTNSLRMALAC